MVTKLQGRVLPNPGWVTALFSSTEYAWIFVLARIYIGLSWWEAGWHKVHDQGYMGGGASLKAFWERIVVVPETGRASISYDWYREFIKFLLDNQTYTCFAMAIALGDCAVGLGLIVGALTGIAAFLGP